jgi:outer membrane protein, multidrug efflux system
VATAYFLLRELDLELEIARRTLESRRASLRLVQTREEGGVASLLEVRQAETLLYTAAAVIPDLERRPDIRQAEQQLVSANAQIGVARALLFPQVALTGSAGVGSVWADGTFFGPQGLFAVGPLLTAPIFNAGQLRANVVVTEAQQQAALWRYLQSIQRAFREVSDGLYGNAKMGLPSATTSTAQQARGKSEGRALLQAACA